MKNKIFFSVTFGFGAFVVAFGLGSILNIATGIPLIGGLLNGVLTAMVLMISVIAVKYWGNSIIMWLTFSLLASVTTTLGPQGIYKIFIGLLAGLIWDTIYWLTRYKLWGAYLGGLLGSASIMFSLVGFLMLGFGKDAEVALQKYMGSFWVIVIMNLVITIIGLYLGNTAYKTRLKNLSVFKNLNS